MDGTQEVSVDHCFCVLEFFICFRMICPVLCFVTEFCSSNLEEFRVVRFGKCDEAYDAEGGAHD